MVKSLITSFFGLLLIFSSYSFAGGPEVKVTPEQNYFSGLYGGVDGGAEWVDYGGFAHMIIHHPGGGPAIFDRSGVIDGLKGKVVGIAAFHIGLGVAMRWLYLAVQGEYELSQATQTHTFKWTRVPTPLLPNPIVQSTTDTFKLENAWSIVVKPGILISPRTLAFVIAGAAFSKVKVNSNGLFVVSPTLNETISGNASKKLCGFRVGVGFEQLLWNHISLAFSYLYTGYSKALNHSILQTSSSNFNFIEVIIKTKPHTNEVRLGINFYI